MKKSLWIVVLFTLLLCTVSLAITQKISVDESGVYRDSEVDSNDNVFDLTTIRTGENFGPTFLGFIDFNTTSIPDNAIVENVSIQLTLSGAPGANAHDISIRGLTNVSTDFANDEIFSACSNGFLYNNTDHTSEVANTPFNISLENSTQNLTANLTGNYFSVCIVDESPVAFSGVLTSFHSNESATKAFIPTLWVTYSLGDQPPNVSELFPANNTVLNTSELTISFTAQDDNNLSNCTLHTNFTGTFQATQTILGSENASKENYTFNTVNLSNRDYIYNVKCEDNAAQTAFHTFNHTVLINGTGNLTITTNNITTTPNTIQNLTVNITCTLNSCGDLSAFLLFQNNSLVTNNSINFSTEFNPLNLTRVSCLNNLEENQSCIFNFTINISENATTNQFRVRANNSRINEVSTNTNALINAQPAIQTHQILGNTSNDNLTCQINISDIDTATLNITFQWYLNNTLNQTNTTSVNSNTLTNIPTITSNLTQKNQNWTCEIRATDTLTTITSNQTVTILNSPPTVNTINDITINKNTQTTLNLSTLTSDPDNDSLNYTLVNLTDITMINITINQSSTIVTFVPVVEFTGSFILLFNVTDQNQTTQSNNFTFTVQNPPSNNNNNNGGGGGGGSPGGSGGFIFPTPTINTEPNTTQSEESTNNPDPENTEVNTEQTVQARSNKTVIDLIAETELYGNQTEIVEKISALNGSLNINRTITIKDGNTYINITLDPKDHIENLSYIEDIPKCVALFIREGYLNETNITWTNDNFTVLEEDPVIMWRFQEADQPIDLSYTVHKVLLEDCLKLIKGTAIADKIQEQVKEEQEDRNIARFWPLILMILTILAILWLEHMNTKLIHHYHEKKELTNIKKQVKRKKHISHS